MKTRNHLLEKQPYRSLATVASLLLWIGIWWAGAAALRKEILLPTPLTVCKRLLVLAGASAYWQAVGGTLLSVLLGILSGIAVGTVLAVLIFRFPAADAFFRPLLTVVRSTPVASFIILAYVWLSKGSIPFAITLLMVFPVICTGVVTGLGSLEPELAEVASLYGFSAGEKLRALYIPSVLPHFRAAVVTACGLGWKAGVAAEALVRVGGSIGGAMMDAKMNYETADVFAWTLSVIVISMLAETVIRFLLTDKNERGR